MLPLASDGVCLSFAFAVVLPDGVGFDEAARPLLESLTPWLLHAARSTRDHGRQLAATRAIHVAFDRVSIGVVLLDPRGQVTYANRSGASCLEQADVPFYRDVTASNERVARVQLGLERVLEHRAVGEASAAAGRSNVMISRLPLEPGHDEGPFGRRVATAIFVGDPAAQSLDSLGAVQKRYGLTPAEARLAALLVSDMSLEEAANRLGVTVGTARTRLKQVFAKTNTHRQASLVRLLLAEGGQLRSEGPEV